jgi:hypothetical protein
MKTSYDDITGITRHESEDVYLYKKGGILFLLRYVKVSFMLSRTADGAQYAWLRVTSLLPDFRDDTNYLHVLVDGVRNSFACDNDLDWSKRWEAYQESFTANVEVDWLRKFALSKHAKIRVAGRDFELPDAARREAASVLTMLR